MPSWSSACLLLILLGLWVFSPGPRELVAALGFSSVGLWMVFFPPASRLPLPVMLLAGLCFVLSLLTFIPVVSGEEQTWRAVIRSAGIPLGSGGTPQPAISLAAVVWQTGVGLIALRLIAGGHRESSRGLVHVLVVLAFVCYGLLAMVRPGLIPPGTYTPETGVPAFGFFPNQNHTGTLLAMGVVLALGILLLGVRRRKFALGTLGGVATLVILFWLIFSNMSRAGMLLAGMGAGILLLLQFLGSRRRAVRRVLVLFLLGAGLAIYAAEDGVKKRMADQFERIGQQEKGSGFRPESLLEGRWNIYRDTGTMIKSHPLAGSGAGQFADLYPRYQEHSVRESGHRHVHPESSWLWIAAEGGIPLGVGLVGLVTIIFWRCGKSVRTGRMGGMSSALTVAAMIPFVHGWIDVPLHRESILWTSALLIGLAMPMGRELKAGGRWAWRAVGGALCLLGVLSLTGGLKSPARQAQEGLMRARAFLKQDEQKLEEGKGGEGPDLVEKALIELQQAAALRPLDRRVHALRGNLALYFDDRDEEAKGSFLRQRLLEPASARVPYLQGLSWIAIERRETLALWGEALEKAQGREATGQSALSGHAEGVPTVSGIATFLRGEARRTGRVFRAPPRHVVQGNP